jgi:hypothetical protein
MPLENGGILISIFTAPLFQSHSFLFMSSLFGFSRVHRHYTMFIIPMQHASAASAQLRTCHSTIKDKTEFEGSAITAIKLQLQEKNYPNFLKAGPLLLLESLTNIKVKG